MFDDINNIDSPALDLGFISEYAANIMKLGGLVVFPTSSIYGLAGDAMNHDIVKKIFCIKNRSFNKPISIIISNMDDLNNVAKPVSSRSFSLMKKLWPGGVTFVVEASGIFPEILTAGTGKIGVRIPLNKTAMSLVRSYGSPITATSANVSGKPGAICIEDIGLQVLDSVNLVINGGSLRGGVGSTVVDTTVYPMKILREGVVVKSKFFE